MKLNNFLTVILGCLFIFSSCEKSTPENGNNDENNPSENPGGYASSGGVMILNQGIRSECSSITYISPDGDVEENVYSKVNGTEFGHSAQDMYMHNGKFYIFSDNCDEFNTLGDGSLVIADAVTMKKEKTFKYEDLKFHKPEGSLKNEDTLYLTTPMSNVVVIDEKNIFISSSKAMFRLDTTTGKMYIVNDSFHFGNQGNTIESVASTKGMTVIGDYAYCGGGGFWETTRLLEFSKDKDSATRKLVDLDGDFISGICRTGEREIMLATCGRQGSTRSYLYFVDIDKWEIVQKKTIPVDISAEFFNNSGVTLAGDYLYFAAGTLNISRISIKDWKVDKNFIDIRKDVPTANYLNCNVVADSKTQYLYVAVSDELGENIVSKGNVLVYDCSKDTPVLVQNIENKTSYPVGIYPVSNFYN